MSAARDAVKKAALRLHRDLAEMPRYVRAWAEAEVAVLATSQAAMWRLATVVGSVEYENRVAMLAVLQRDCRFREWNRALEDLKSLESALCTALEELAAEEDAEEDTTP